MKNPYEVLGIPVTASIEEVKAAFRRKAKETHPDLHGGSQEYAARFREVTDAYAILSDPVLRSRFDNTGSVDPQQAAAAAQEIYEIIAYIRRQTREARSSAMRGLAWLIGGAVITFLGYYGAASSGGGRYPIFWGAILFGGIQALRGFIAYAKIDAKASALEQEIWNHVTGATQNQPSKHKSAPENPTKPTNSEKDRVENNKESRKSATTKPPESKPATDPENHIAPSEAIGYILAGAFVGVICTIIVVLMVVSSVPTRSHKAVAEVSEDRKLRTDSTNDSTQANSSSAKKRDEMQGFALPVRNSQEEPHSGMSHTDNSHEGRQDNNQKPFSVIERSYVPLRSDRAAIPEPHTQSKPGDGVEGKSEGVPDRRSNRPPPGFSKPRSPGSPPQNPYYQATQLQQHGEFAGAIEVCSDILQSDRKNARAWILRAWCKLRLGQYESAITDCNTALALAPQNSHAHSNRAFAYYKTGHYTFAINDASRAITLNPRNAHAYLFRALALEALVGRPQTKATYEQVSRAKKDYETARAIDPTLNRLDFQ